MIDYHDFYILTVMAYVLGVVSGIALCYILAKYSIKEK